MRAVSSTSQGTPCWPRSRSNNAWVRAILLAGGGDDGQLPRLGLHLGVEAQIGAHVEMPPAELRALHQDAERPAHAAAAFGDRVEDGSMLLGNLVPPRDGRDAGHGERRASLRRCRRRPWNGW